MSTIIYVKILLQCIVSNDVTILREIIYAVANSLAWMAMRTLMFNKP